MNTLQVIKIINGGGIQDHSWAVGMRANYTEGNEEYNEDTTIRGVSLGGSQSRSINIWSIVPTDDTNIDHYSTFEIYHAKARHSNEEER